MAPLSSVVNESPYGPGNVAPLSSVMHTLNSVYRYPNFLSRHPLTSLHALESDLLSYVSEFQRQKSLALSKWEQVNSRREKFLLLHPHIILPDGELLPSSPDASVILSITHPCLHHLIKRNLPTSPTSPFLASLPSDLKHQDADLEAIVDMPGAEFGKDVYSIAVFTGEFSDALKDHMRKYREFLESEGPGEGRRNVDLRHVPGLEFVDEFLSSFIFSPLSKSLFPKYGNLTWHQTYSALYDSDETGKPRTSLDLHTDDSEVTGNLCLDDSFTGGELLVSGRRGDAKGVSDSFELEKGVMIMHEGRTFHEVKECKGRRETLITWGRNERWRERVCPCCFYRGTFGGGCLCEGSRGR